MRPPCAPKGARSERRGAPQVARGCACAARRVLVRGRCCASKRARAFTPSCRASIVPRTATNDEAAREAAGKAALLRAKESLSTGWAARLCCEQRGRLAAARLPQLRGVRQRVLAVESARECAPERAARECSRFQSASVCVCGHSRASRGACSRPRTNATVSACSRLRTNAEIAGVNARVPWTNAILGGE